jgi:hypothetical protein
MASFQDNLATVASFQDNLAPADSFVEQISMARWWRIVVGRSQ